MKVTIDSTEPLADALRVVGALYNVNLAEVPATDDTPPAEPAQGERARATTANLPRRTNTSIASTESRSRGPRRLATATSRDMRAWALANGHAVSDRGTLPAAVKAAHAEAHKS